MLMKTKMIFGLIYLTSTSLFASTGTEQAKMLVMALGGVVIILIAGFRSRNKK